jgi:hypothetical protein
MTADLERLLAEVTTLVPRRDVGLIDELRTAIERYASAEYSKGYDDGFNAGYREGAEF